MTSIASSPATVTTATQRSQPIVVKRSRFTWSLLGNIVAIVVILLWCMLPFYWMVVMSFRHPSYAFDSSPFFSHFTWSNFQFAFNTTNNHFGRALVNSLIIGAVVTLLSMIVGVFAAYASARLQFRGKSLLLSTVLAASMFPQVALLTALFQLFTSIGWLGTYQGLIIPQIAFALPLAVYTLTSFFTQMPWELEQAAKVDGATPLQAFRLVIFPLAAPALFTTAILVFLGSWNEFLLSYNLYNGNDNVAPVTVAIAKFTAGPHVTPYTQTMAAGLVITIPLVIVVLLFQRRIVSGLTAGGVKG